MSRFFVAPEDVGAEYIVIDNKEDLHHMNKVLRLKAGVEIDISDGDMWEYHGRISSLDSEHCRVEILDKQKFSAEPQTRITLYQGIPKQGKMELIVQKAVELGACSIVPVFMDRTVVTDKGNFTKKIQRWQKVSSEAVKQCRRGIIPQVEEAIKLPEVIERFAEYDLVLFPYENEDGITIKDVIRSLAKGSDYEGGTVAGETAEQASAAPGEITEQTGATADDSAKSCNLDNIAIIIGPEGGFSDNEAEQIVDAGGRSVSLGKTTLRTETAGLAAIAMTMYELEL